MNPSDLRCTGFNKRVAALHRDSGEILWQWQAPSGHRFVSLLLDGERLIVSVDGYTYALDPCTGRQLWMNEMVGFGSGVATLVSVHGSSSAHLLAAAQATAASAATTSGSAAAS